MKKMILFIPLQNLLGQSCKTGTSHTQFTGDKRIAWALGQI
jgi:hypothetical protein